MVDKIYSSQTYTNIDDISSQTVKNNLKLCTNLYPEFEIGVMRYYCASTGKSCVAEKFGLWQKFNEEAVLNTNILLRCSSRRKEISDVVEEKGDSQ